MGEPMSQMADRVYEGLTGNGLSDEAYSWLVNQMDTVPAEDVAFVLLEFVSGDCPGDPVTSR